MKMLPESFTKKGFSHRQEFREGNVAIYKRWKGEGRAHWETIVVREASAKSYDVPTMKDGHPVTLTIEREEGEIYPSTSQWGDLGWTYGTFEEARAKAVALLLKPRNLKP